MNCCRICCAGRCFSDYITKRWSCVERFVQPESSKPTALRQGSLKSNSIISQLTDQVKEDDGRWRKTVFFFIIIFFFWGFVVVEPILFCYVPDSNWRRACRWGLYLSLCLSLFSVLVNTANLIICEVGEWQHWLTYVERKKLKEGPLSVFAMQGR